MHQQEPSGRTPCRNATTDPIGASGDAQPTRYERSDVTSVPAASTVAEATVAFTIANAFLEKYGGDNFEEIKRRFDAETG